MNRRTARFGAAVLLCMILSACALHRPPPIETMPGSREEGLASWYGKKFHGRRTASGEVYDMNAMTAAHRTLPFGTAVRVENRDNGRSADVVVNDRGPFVKGRVIDLSYAAARAVGLVGSGVARVRVTVLGAADAGRGRAQIQEENDAAAPFTVQVGAFEDPANAVAVKSRLGGGWGPVVIVPVDAGDGRRLYRVTAGIYRDPEQAAAAARKMEDEGVGQTFVTRKDP